MLMLQPLKAPGILKVVESVIIPNVVMTVIYLNVLLFLMLRKT